MLLLRLSILLLVVFPLQSAARRIPWRPYRMLSGTPYASYAWIYRAKRKGPAVLLFAPHGDERSAGYALLRLVRRWRPNRGTVIACPVPVPRAWRGNKRLWIEDMNRQFAPGAFNHTPVDLIASEVRYLIRKYRPELLLNIHEGWGFFRDSWKDYGQSLVVDTLPLARRAQKLVKRINRGIRIRKHHFYPTLKPMPGTLTYWAQEQGIAAYGIEVSRLIPIRMKIRYQLWVLRVFLRDAGIRLRYNR